MQQYCHNVYCFRLRFSRPSRILIIPKLYLQDYCNSYRKYLYKYDGMKLSIVYRANFIFFTSKQDHEGLFCV